MENKELIVKANYNGDFRVFEVHEASFNLLETAVRKQYGLDSNKITLKFQDNEQDLITISSDTELSLALRLIKPPLRIEVSIDSRYRRKMAQKDADTKIDGSPEEISRVCGILQRQEEVDVSKILIDLSEITFKRENSRLAVNGHRPSRRSQFAQGFVAHTLTLEHGWRLDSHEIYFLLHRFGISASRLVELKLLHPLQKAHAAKDLKDQYRQLDNYDPSFCKDLPEAVPVPSHSCEVDSEVVVIAEPVAQSDQERPGHVRARGGGRGRHVRGRGGGRGIAPPPGHHFPPHHRHHHRHHHHHHGVGRHRQGHPGGRRGWGRGRWAAWAPPHRGGRQLGPESALAPAWHPPGASPPQGGQEECHAAEALAAHLNLGPEEGEGRQFGNRCRHPLVRFVRHVTLEDQARVGPGQKVVKTWRVRNDALRPWPNTCELVRNGARMEGLESAEATSVAGGLSPGQECEISITLTTPTEPGLYDGYWRMREVGGRKFGQRLWAILHVVDESHNVTRQRQVDMGNELHLVDDDEEEGVPFFVSDICREYGEI